MKKWWKMWENTLVWNKLDDVIMFHAFSIEELKKIDRLQMEIVAGCLEHECIFFEVTNAAYDYVFKKSYNQASSTKTKYLFYFVRLTLLMHKIILTGF